MKTEDIKKLNISRIRETPSNSKEIPWYGFNDYKNKIEQTLKDSMNSMKPFGILIQGTWGAGKTHTARHYCISEALNEGTTDSSLYSNTTSIYLEGPKVSNTQPFKEFFDRVVMSVGLRALRKKCAAIKDSGNLDNFLDAIYELTHDDDIVSIFENIPDTSKDMHVRSILKGASTKKERDGIGVVGKLDRDIDYVNILLAICRTITWENDGKSEQTRLFLWMDELENFVYLKSAQHQNFAQNFRQFFDSCEHLTCVLFFSFANPSEFGVAEEILSSALTERINKKIELPFLDELGRNSYLTDLINDVARHSEVQKEGPIPFTEDSLKYFSSEIGELTPRQINRIYVRLIENIISDSDISLPLESIETIDDLIEAIEED